MPKTYLKKIILSFFVFLILSFSFVPVARAQTWYNPGFQEWFLKVYDTSNPNEIFGERYTAAQVQWIFYTLLSVPFKILGYDITKCLFTLDIGPCISAALTSTVPKPIAIQATRSNQSIVQEIFKDRSLSGITYFKNVLRKFQIIPPAHAQTGFGFNALDPVLPFWKATRNIAYAIMVLVILVFAFMIMFRVKISPQVVISVQSALPKVVLAIILITFSYAIAGFLVDLMYVVIGLVSLMVTGFFPAGTVRPIDIFSLLTLGNPSGTGNPPLGVFGLFVIYLGSFILVAALVLFTIIGALGSFLLALAAILPLWIPGVAEIALIIGLLVLLIILILLALMFVKIIWMLLKAFASVMLLTIFAPLYLAAGALVPAFSFGSWVKSFVSHLATFVVTGVLFALAFLFLIMSIGTIDQLIPQDLLSRIIALIFGTAATGWATSSFSGWPPLISFIDRNSTSALLFLGASLAVFFIIPKAAELIQSFITGKPFAFGMAIGETVSPTLTRTVAGYGAGYFERRVDTRAPGGEVVGPRTAGFFKAISTLLGQYSRGGRR